MAIREIKQTFFSAEIKKMMIKSHYLSLFVSATALQTEKDHIEGFAPEIFLQLILVALSSSLWMQGVDLSIRAQVLAVSLWSRCSFNPLFCILRWRW